MKETYESLARRGLQVLMGEIFQDLFCHGFLDFCQSIRNHIVEQDHRAVKRVTRPMLEFKSFEAAQGTLVGIELMHMIKKGQMAVEEGVAGLTPAQ
jgi:transposase-like protein